MMYYALIDCRSCCSAMTHLAWGTLQDIANDLINNINELIDISLEGEGMTEKEYEAEYGDDISGFREFEGFVSYTEGDICNFSFSISDMSVEVGCLVQGYRALVKAYDEYVEDKMTLCEWNLVPEIEESDNVLRELNNELCSLNDSFGTDREIKYFFPREEE